MKISARSDYAVRAALELAHAAHEGGFVKGDVLSTNQHIPVKFLENIMVDLRRADLVRSQRGADGGYSLARAADAITIADVIRAVDGPLAYVRGERPEEIEYGAAAQSLVQVWVALRASIRSVLESVTLADVERGDLPELVEELLATPDAWAPH